MTECLALIPMQKWPNAACFFVGDPKQFGPVSLSSDTRWFKDLFGKQRKVSLIDRAYFAGQVDIILRENYRCRGAAGHWVRDTFYKNELSIMNRRCPYARRVATFMERYSDKAIEFNLMWFDVRESFQHEIGTSYTNPTQTRFVVGFCITLFRQCPIPDMRDAEVQLSDQSPNNIRRGGIMIITANAQQKALYEFLIAEISAAEIIPEFLTVRTIDQSRSYQTPVVFVDLVRTGKCGFINDDARLAVAMWTESNSWHLLCTFFFLMMRLSQS